MKTLLSSTALAALLLAGGATQAATLIQSCPFTAITPGTYALARDLICPGAGAAITVAANNVNLVLAGTLTGPFNPNFATIGIFARDVTDLKITGGTIVGFDNSIVLGNIPGTKITGVTANGSFSVSIALGGCGGCKVTGNTVTGSSGDGIQVQATTGAKLAGNTVTGNGGVGIFMIAGATDNRVQGNTVTGNGSDLRDGNLPNCVNTWKGNDFVTDNEGDGPGAGCIR